VVDPDICTLFSRYANAGRTINVYDWFESFVQGVEATRPRKVDPPKGKGKGKVQKSTADDEEAWRREIYGRFMWAIHEMDMLGLLPRDWEEGSRVRGKSCVGCSRMSLA
jgi:origin recognition complex subunit 3